MIIYMRFYNCSIWLTGLYSYIKISRTGTILNGKSKKRTCTFQVDKASYQILSKIKENSFFCVWQIQYVALKPWKYKTFFKTLKKMWNSCCFLYQTIVKRGLRYKINFIHCWIKRTFAASSRLACSSSLSYYVWLGRNGFAFF